MIPMTIKRIITEKCLHSIWQNLINVRKLEEKQLFIFYSVYLLKAVVHMKAQAPKPLKNKIKYFSIYTQMCKCCGPRSVSRGQACCVMCWSPSEELLHAVKQTVVSVWPFQWGTFSPLQNKAKKQDVNLETKRKKRADKCHHYATISTETARPTPHPHPLAWCHNYYHSATPSDVPHPYRTHKNKHS